jgi:hypothetical protein
MMRYIKQLVHQAWFAKASKGILLRAKARESPAKRKQDSQMPGRELKPVSNRIF